MQEFRADLFKSPPKSARPMVRWWWPGLDVEKDELLDEVRLLDENGFYGGEIQAVNPFQAFPPVDGGQHARANRFQTDYYREMVSAVAEEAERRGLAVDLTVSSGWPAGGVGVPLEDGVCELVGAVVTVTGGGERHVALPTAREAMRGWAARVHTGPCPDEAQIADRLERLCVTAARIEGPGPCAFETGGGITMLAFASAIDLTAFTAGDGLAWSFPEGEWAVFCLYQGSTGKAPMLSVGDGTDCPLYTVNHLDAGPILRHLDRHLGDESLLPYLGAPLRSFFSDSLEFTSHWLWTWDFLHEFKRRRGYDLTPYLPAAFMPGRDSNHIWGMDYRPCFDFSGGMGERVRHDYSQTFSDLFIDRFMGAMYGWAERHHMQSRAQVYGAQIDNLRAFGMTHIPETEQLFAGGAIDFLKLAGSAALLYDKPLVTAESLVWRNQAYRVTPLKIKAAADRLFVSGVNQMIYHGFPYRHSGYGFPGYHAFEGRWSFSSHIGPGDSLWRSIGEVNAYICRMQYALQNSVTSVDAAVFDQIPGYRDNRLPTEELGGGELPGFDAPSQSDAYRIAENRDDIPDRGPDARGGLWLDSKMSQDTALAGYALMEAGYDYIHINEERVLSAHIADGALHVGGAVLRALVIPNAEAISVPMARKIVEMTEAGVAVIFTEQTPRRQPGLANYAENDRAVSECLSGKPAVPVRDLADSLQRCGVSPAVRPVRNAEGLMHIHKKAGKLDLYFIRSRLPESRIATVALPHPEKGVRILNGWTGESAPLPLPRGGAGGALELDLPLGPYGSVMLLIGDEAELPAAAKSAPHHGVRPAADARTHTVRPDNWDFSGEPFAPLQAEAVALELSALEDWAENPRLRYFSGEGTYRARFDWDKPVTGPLLLDLGAVYDTAGVTLNGVFLGELLIPPYTFDVSGILRRGLNTIEVRVNNALYNGLIGMAKARRDASSTDAPSRENETLLHFEKKTDLLPSGLIGPVRILF